MCALVKVACIYFIHFFLGKRAPEVEVDRIYVSLFIFLCSSYLLENWIYFIIVFILLELSHYEGVEKMKSS